MKRIILASMLLATPALASDDCFTNTTWAGTFACCGGTSVIVDNDGVPHSGDGGSFIPCKKVTENSK